MTNYSESTRKTFSLTYDEQAANMACKCLDITIEQLSELVGIYKKGKNKGKLKGEFRYDEITKGGWYKTGGYMDGYITYPQKYNFSLVVLEYHHGLGQYALSENSVKMVKQEKPVSLAENREKNRTDFVRLTMHFTLTNGHVRTVKDSFQYDENESLDRQISNVIDYNSPDESIGCVYDYTMPDL